MKQQCHINFCPCDKKKHLWEPYLLDLPEMLKISVHKKVLIVAINYQISEMYSNDS